MTRCFASRAAACLAALGILLSGSLPARAQFTRDSCLGAFGEPVLSGGTNGVGSIVAGDLNRDGHPDLATASIGDDRIVWFENLPNQDDPTCPEFTTCPEFIARTITNLADGATSVAIADLDGDCETEVSAPCLDVISASANDNTIAWYRNNGQSSPKFERHEISTGALLAQAVYAADVDGDGTVDVLSASFQDSKIAWYQNDTDMPGRSFEEHIISENAWGAASVFAIDMDRDGDTDVLSASRLDDKVAWYENLGPPADGAPPAFTEHVISSADTSGGSATVRATYVVAEDLTGDTFPDVVVASNGDGTTTGRISWFESSGVLPLTFTEHTIFETMSGASEVFTTDVDADGEIDVLAAYVDTIAWFKRDAMSETGFGDEIVISQTALGATGVYAADLNGDTWIDIQSASTVAGQQLLRDDKVAWYVNPGFPRGDDSPVFEEEIISGNAQSPESIATADFDADGSLDVVFASSVDDTIAWQRNQGGDPVSFAYYEIATDADRALSVAAADLDGNCPAGEMGSDPCMDVVSAAPADGVNGTIVWYQNDGTPSDGFLGEPIEYQPPDFIAHVILEGTEDPTDPAPPSGTSFNAAPMAVFSADLDGTNGRDVIGAIRVPALGVPDRISWFENDGAIYPAVPEFTEHVITRNLDGPRSVFAADIDADGDVDVLAASTDDNKITLLVNDGLDASQDPAVLAFAEVTISTNALGAFSVSAADLFGDCNETEPAPCLEVLSASSNDNKIAWYEMVTEPPPAAAPGEPKDDEPGPAITGGGGTGPMIALSPDTLTFDNVFVGRVDSLTGDPAPAKLVVEVRNDGDETLSISSITSNAAEFTPAPTELTIDAGTSRELVVGFLPTRGATFTGTIEFTSNAANNDPAPSVSVTGTGLEFVEKILTLDSLFARHVSAGDVDNDGLTDVLSVSSGDRTISAFLQLATDPVTFREQVITDFANDARSALVANLDGDAEGTADVVTAYYFEIAWHQGGISEVCNLFDVDSDDRMAGVELSWIWLSFTESGEPGGTEWWRAVDYNLDDIIDGDDVAIAASSGVWTKFVNPATGNPEGPVCTFSCVFQEPTMVSNDDR